MNRHCLGARKKTVRGLHTKPNVWDAARKLNLWRTSPVEGGKGKLEELDPGVNYFVLMLNQMGFPTHFSCEGHPDGFYITFGAPYEAALRISEVGYFNVEIEGEDYWSLRKHPLDLAGGDPARTHIDGLRWAAKAWEDRLGPLDFESVELSVEEP